ncbi:hypothetical protein [Paraflavitalea pollutisoli]|uniref:hypothetical protein n=1 Tax=Paraflavitalea pollutisoli TaxID=3034143 RepID=UPI0023EA978C|nr:hypothetical protein [Paraflavitalea sp. H1-2-19X]
MIKHIRKSILGLLVIALVMGCKKEKTAVPPSFIHFDFANAGSYFITQDGKSSYKIVVGLTTPADIDRTVNISVSSPSGAVEGQQYTLSKKTITIPAGQTIDSIIVKGLYAGFSGGRQDTLVFGITGGNASPLEEAKSYTLALQQYCEVDIDNFAGLYTGQDYQDGATVGGAYDIYFTPVATTGATSGTLSVDGLWEVPIPVNVNIDWKDPSNFTTEVPVQPWFMHSTYGQITIRPAGKGTFSSCSNTFEIRFEVTAPGGTFGQYVSIIHR